jgi:ectoine hydroxylase-related dioxygenase (phytanoyl-CoA dioxygenase family)
MDAGGMISDGLKTEFDRDGYIALPGLLSGSEVDALCAEATAIATGERGEVLGAEELAGRGEAALAKVLAIHFPHKASPLMRGTLFHPRIVEVLEALVGPDVKAMQSMLFVKNAGKPGQAWHQDEHYIPTRDRSLIGVWIALDDATIDNGCLWMHPGSHRHGIIWPTRAHGDPRFDNGEEAHAFPYEREGGVPVEIGRGGVAFFNGYTLHRSLDNKRASGYRRALVNHYMSARSMLPWAFGLPPTPRDDFRDIVMVAGEDPYAYKGLADITFPFVRPEDPAQAMNVFGRAAAFAAKRSA